MYVFIGFSSSLGCSLCHQALSCDSPNDSDLAAVVDELEEIPLASADVQVEDVVPDESPEYRYVSEVSLKTSSILSFQHENSYWQSCAQTDFK